MQIPSLNFFKGGHGEHHARIKVNWSNCCVNKNEGGLGLIYLKGAFITFLCKCIISALKIRETNLKTLVCLFHCMSSKHKKWILVHLFPMQNIKFWEGAIGCCRFCQVIMWNNAFIQGFPMQSFSLPFGGAYFGNSLSLG